MQLDTTAPSETLAQAFDATQAAILALRSLDVSPVDDPAVELLRERRDLIARELERRGLRPCGVCYAPKPAAVDWGCTCDQTPEEIAADARQFARIHD